MVRLDNPADLIVQAQLPAIPEVRQGDVIQFSGDVSPPSQATTAVAAGLVWANRITVVGNRSPFWQRFRSSIANKAASLLTTAVPLPAGSLAAGVLIGDDSALTSRERDQFRAAGLSHITAVSGWNIALITGLLMALHGYIPLPLTLRILLCMLGIWIYSYITGAEPSAVRAAVMGTICLIAIWRGRPRDALTILLWAIALMLAIQPQTRYSLGFQLSVFATLGLVLAMPLTAKCPGWLALVLVPAVAEISVAPILLHHLGQYSIASPLANLLVAPLVVPLAASSAVTVAISFISGSAGQIAGVIPWILGKLIMGVAGFVASIPGASGRTPYLGWSTMVLLYVVLASAFTGTDWLLRRSDQANEPTLAFDASLDDLPSRL